MDIPVVKMQGTISRGVVSVYVDEAGNLMMLMSNGELLNLGTVTGSEGIPGVGIKSVEQTATSTESGGTNEVTVTLTSGEAMKFYVFNGVKGDRGDAGEPGPKGDRGDSGASAQNLLDNGDFTNPINLPGAGNAITRWTIGNNGSVEIKDGCIGIKNSSTSSRITFTQQLPRNYVGEEVTIAVCDNDTGEIHYSSAIVPAVQSTETYFNVVNFGGAEGKDNACRLSLTGAGVLQFQIVVKTSSTLNVRWAAMYKGNITLDALKLFTPKGYNIELLNCGGYARTESFKNTLPASGWSGSAPYTQSITVSGILASDEPFVDVNLKDVSNGAEILEAWSVVGRITASANNTITAYCYEEKPAVDIPILLKVVR